jgi:RTX calcium-binding nonapeptide repeat (4 copies)
LLALFLRPAGYGWYGMKRGALFVAGLLVAALVVASGVAWAASMICPNWTGDQYVGTDNKDTMTGGMFGCNDEMRAKGGADEVRGRGGADTLSGGPGADAITGGKGKDALAGGEGPDALKGGSADDSYTFFTESWGNDTITDTNSDSDPLTYDSGNVVAFGHPHRVLHTRLTINLTSSPSAPEVRNGALTGTVNWSNNAIDSVSVLSTIDDTINGNASANSIVARGGAGDSDTINAEEAGRDKITVLDGAGGDTVDCGGQQQDLVFADAGDTVKNCFEPRQPTTRSVGGP